MLMKDSYDLKWFVLRVKPNHEKKVTQLLLELNFQAYNPIVKVKRKWSDRIKTIELPWVVDNASWPQKNGFDLSNHRLCFLKIS